MSDGQVLVVAPRFPLPLKSGGQLRIYHTLAELHKRFDITLVSLVLNGEGKNHIRELEERGIDVRPVFHDRSMRGALVRFATSRRTYRMAKFENDELKRRTAEITDARDFDFVWVHFLTTIALLPSELPTPVIVDQHNADVDYWETFRDGTLPEQVFAVVNQRRLRRLREPLRSRIDAILSVSEPDARTTRRWADDTEVWVVPNGVDVSKFSPGSQSKPREVVFIGSLDRRRNEEAIRWFAESSLPGIQENYPDTEFRIIGRNPTRKVRDLDERAGVTVVGEVPDVVPHYERATVVVAPFVLGGGTKLKVLEALAMEKPLVTTPKGAAGIDIVDGKHALIRDRDSSFGSAIGEMFESPEKQRRLGSEGRTLVRERYSWSRILSDALRKIDDRFLA